MKRRLLLLLTVALIGGTVSAQEAPQRPIVIGSKTFTESRLLAEIMAQLIEAHTDARVERRFGLGGTKICFDALCAGEIDLYPEYTGTGLVTILGGEALSGPLQTYIAVQTQFRERYDLVWLAPFGFNNTYAMAMREARAEALGVRTISDLAAHAGELHVGVSHEFLSRKDGWPGLSGSYSLGDVEIRGMEHGLAYAAIESGEIDLIDAYSTDGKLLRYRLRVLEDDRGYFPQYHAAPVVRAQALKGHPELEALLERLALRLPDARMQRLNFLVEEEKRSFEEVARSFLVEEGWVEGAAARTDQPSARKRGFFALLGARWRKTLALTWQHLELTLLAVLLATLVSVPLGVLCTRVPWLAQPVLGGAGVIQTIPSLALLAFMIPIPGLGLGATSAVVALFLYALLPIVRNTYTGIREVDADLIEAARGMGLEDLQILRYVQSPLATRTIMAGIRTSTVISVGVATLAAFIGAGGLGEPILTGLQLNDTNLILTGAVPAALLAVLVDGVLAGVERLLVPRTERAQAA
jgi:osmoprotectant transport system permease protein